MMTVFDAPHLCVQAAIDLAKQTGKQRVLVSGSLHPVWGASVKAQLVAEHIGVNDVQPDPLGFENLVSGVFPDMACVIIQNPSFFGNVRDLTAVTLECREWEVPLLQITPPQGNATPDAAQALASKLRQIPKVRVVTDHFINRFSLYLGDEVDSAEVLDHLRALGLDFCESAALAYPDYPELRPVLIVNTPAHGEAFVSGLREALALVANDR